MSVPAGGRCTLYYDGQALTVGDYLRTPTGRTYLIESVRVQQAGRHTGRQHLIAVVMPEDHVTEPDARVLPLYWYRR